LLEWPHRALARCRRSLHVHDDWMLLCRQPPIGLARDGLVEMPIDHLPDHAASIVVTHESCCERGNQTSVAEQTSLPAANGIGGFDERLKAGSLERIVNRMCLRAPAGDRAQVPRFGGLRRELGLRLRAA